MMYCFTTVLLFFAATSVRRRFGILVVCILVLFAPGLPGKGACSDTASMRQEAGALRDDCFSPDSFCGERLDYSIAFWLFSRAATGSLRFVRTGQNRYEAVFEARTAGLLRFIAGNRRGVMRSRMEYDTIAKRFRPCSFEELFVHGSDNRTRRITYDYQQGTYCFIRMRGGTELGRATGSLPAGNIDDILTAYYNLRSGRYGRVLPESNFSIPLLVTDRQSTVLIEFEKRPPRDDLQAYYAVASMSRDVSQVGSKRIAGWLSKELIPLTAVIEDAYLFGDIGMQLVYDGETDRQRLSATPGERCRYFAELF
jgi:hypothetical protein